jgi:hypothetical protein
MRLSKSKLFWTAMPEWRFFRPHKTPLHGRRIEVQPNDIGCLGFEQRVVGCHVALQTMRFQTVLSPDPSHHHMRYIERFTELATAPMRRAIGRSFLRPGKDPGFDLSFIFCQTSPSMAGIKSTQTIRTKASPPPIDIVGRARELLADRLTNSDHHLT